MTEQLQPARKVIAAPLPEGRQGQNTENVLFCIRTMGNTIGRQLKRIQVDYAIAGKEEVRGWNLEGGKGD